MTMHGQKDDKYCTVGIFGEVFNLVIWQSTCRKKITKIKFCQY